MATGGDGAERSGTEFTPEGWPKTSPRPAALEQVRSFQPVSRSSRTSERPGSSTHSDLWPLFFWGPYKSKTSFYWRWSYRTNT